MAPFCRYFLKGKCQRGEHCNYRHSGPPLPPATAIKQPPTVPEFAPETVTRVIGDIKGTFGAGAVPQSIEFLSAERPAAQVDRLVVFLGLTWYKPLRNIWLQFRSKADAEKAIEALNGKVLENVTLAAAHQASRSKNVFSVQITAVTENVLKWKLLKLLPEGLKSAKVRLGPMSYTLKDAGATVLTEYIKDRTKLPISVIRYRTAKQHTKRHAEFVFEDMADLGALARKMNGIKIEEFGNTKVFAEECLKLNLSVSRRLYQQRCLTKNLAAEIWKKHNVQVHIDDARVADGRVKIEMTASNRKSLQQAKCLLDEFFVEQEQARSVPKEVEQPKQQTHRIRLTKTKAFVSAQAIFPEIEKTFGEKVVLDRKSDPPAIVVLGNTATLRKVQRILRENKPPKKKGIVPCSSCMDDDVDDFVRLKGCRHVICTDCFGPYCTTDQEVGKFPVRCFEPGCNKHIAMFQLQGNLEESELTALLSASLRDHMQRHPQEFAQCPGEDCTAHYRIGEEGARRLCPNCLTNICSHCNVESHTGMSCAEYRAYVANAADQAEMARWMQQMGAQNCPRCAAVVQKDRGCNNVVCGLCHCCFCWVCLEVCGDYQAVYRHLQEKHGGYYDIGGYQQAMAAIVNGLGPEEQILNGIDQIRHPDWAHVAGLDANQVRPGRRIMPIEDIEAFDRILHQPNWPEIPAGDREELHRMLLGDNWRHHPAHRIRRLDRIIDDIPGGPRAPGDEAIPIHLVHPNDRLNHGGYGGDLFAGEGFIPDVQERMVEAEMRLLQVLEDLGRVERGNAMD